MTNEYTRIKHDEDTRQAYSPLTKLTRSLSISSASRQPSSSDTALEQNRTLHSLESTKIIASDSSCIKRSAQRFRLVNSNVDGKELVELEVVVGLAIAVTLDDDDAGSWVLNSDAGLCISGDFTGCELVDIGFQVRLKGWCWSKNKV